MKIYVKRELEINDLSAQINNCDKSLFFCPLKTLKIFKIRWIPKKLYSDKLKWNKKSDWKMSKMDKLFQNVTFSTDIIGNDNLVCVLKVANHQKCLLWSF